jgi:hypothetical protein
MQPEPAMPFHELDEVRVVDLREAIRDWAGSGPQVERPPQVGDIGTVVNVRTDARGEVWYYVECVGAGGFTVWLAEFRAAELALSTAPETPAGDFTCPVCGYPGLYDPPEPGDPSHFESQEICPCCGTQLGYQDGGPDPTLRQHRQAELRLRWVAGGMHWWSTGGRQPPPQWDPKSQLRGIGFDLGDAPVWWPDDLLAPLRVQARELVRHTFATAAGMVQVDLDQINRVRPPKRQYRSQENLVRHWFYLAGAEAWLAVTLGLLTPAEAVEIAREFQSFDPDADEVDPPNLADPPFPASLLGD